jgi:hypothetical protein
MCRWFCVPIWSSTYLLLHHPSLMRTAAHCVNARHRAPNTTQDLTRTRTATKACEVKAQLQGAVQGAKSQVSGAKFGSEGNTAMTAMPQDVTISMDAPEKKGFRFELVIIG